jgi:hypothetical protein
MAIYRVLLPASAVDQAAMAARADFVRDGFCWPAFLFGPLWLLARGLWLALGAWCLGAAIVLTGAHYARAPGFAVEGLYWLSALWLGLEGPGLVVAARRRGGFRLVDISVGADAAAAEFGFFSRWLAEPAPAPPPARAAVPTAPAHVIGLFPEAGG